MNPVESRFIELTTIHCYRDLNETEQQELIESHQYILNQQWKLAKLKNLSLMASMTNDFEWLHHICAQIEQVEGG